MRVSRRLSAHGEDQFGVVAHREFAFFHAPVRRIFQNALLRCVSSIGDGTRRTERVSDGRVASGLRHSMPLDPPASNNTHP